MSLFTFEKPVVPQVLAPDFESVVMPTTDEEMQMTRHITPHALLDPRVADYFILGQRSARYMQLKQPNGKPYLDLRVDNVLKRFYVFALPAQPGSAKYHDDANYMVAVQCSVTQPSPNVFSVMPEKLYRGTEAHFVMSASFACCGSGKRGRAMLYSDTSQSRGPFLNMGFAGDNLLRPEIRAMWKKLEVVVLSPAGAMALSHLAKDLTGTCTAHNTLVNPGKMANWRGQALKI